MLASLLTTLFFSLSVVFANRSIRLVGSAKANLSRLIFATLCLALYSHLFAIGLKGPGLWHFLFSGIIGFGLGDLALFQAIPRLGSRLTILMTQCLAAPLGAFIEWLWLGTTLSLLQIACGATILFGVALAIAPKEHAHRPASVLAWGLFYGFFSALGQGWGAVISRKAFDIDLMAGISIGGVNAAYQRIWGGVVVAVLAYVLWGEKFDPASADTNTSRPSGSWRKAAPWILLNGLAGPVFGVSCYQWALGELPTGIVLSIVATSPLVIMPFTFALEGDKPTWRSFIGAIIAVAGVIALALHK
jgi:drug/metabolite transporter (DMT)-like permease